ncbi:MAG: ATP-binding protein [Defluviitaleaceae bacterium]|nr:ATP-binding protein [Defluviitaleaceae bacterium]
MDTVTAIINAFVIALFFYLTADKFMCKSQIVKLGCFIILFIVQIIFNLFLLDPVVAELSFLILFIIISFFINLNFKNYLKSANSALSMLIIFMVFVHALGGLIFSVFPGIFSFYDHIYNIIMQVCVLAFAVILRRYQGYFFNAPNDTKLLQSYVIFKAFFFIASTFGLSALFIYLADSDPNMFHIVQLSLTTSVIIGFFCERIISKRSLEVEIEKRRSAVEIASYTVKAETVNKNYDEIISFKHYTASLYRSMSGYINTEDWKGLENYFKKNIALINDELHKEVEGHDQIKHIHIEMIKARIVDLINTISLLPNVSLVLYVDNIIDYAAMKEMDLFKILTIFIDNAVEEVTSQEKGKITIFMHKDVDGCFFRVENTLIGSESTPKPNNTHRGLKIVADICANYPNANVTTDIKPGSYVKTIEILNI